MECSCPVSMFLPGGALLVLSTTASMVFPCEALLCRPSRPQSLTLTFTTTSAFRFRWLISFWRPNSKYFLFYYWCLYKTRPAKTSRQPILRLSTMEHLVILMVLVRYSGCSTSNAEIFQNPRHRWIHSPFSPSYHKTKRLQKKDRNNKGKRGQIKDWIR